MPKPPSPQSLSLWLQSARASEHILLCMGLTLTTRRRMTPHTMPGPIVFHCKSTQVRNGGKIEILEELERLGHSVGNTKRGETTLLQASGGVAVPLRLMLASHEESLMHPLTNFCFIYWLPQKWASFCFVKVQVCLPYSCSYVLALADGLFKPVYKGPKGYPMYACPLLAGYRSPDVNQERDEGWKILH